MEPHHQPSTDRNRRRFFRIDDRVGLRMTPIAADQEAAAVAGFDNACNQFGLLNDLQALRDISLPKRRALELKFPTVAAYAAVIERQIDILGQVINAQTAEASNPETPINLSAQGMRVEVETPYPDGTLVEVRLTLFPERSRILTLGRVLSSSHESGDGDQTMAIEFAHLRKADREAIVRHVQARQLQRIQDAAPID